MEKSEPRIVTLFRDMRGENWKSMDRYADNLQNYLFRLAPENYSFSVFAEEKSGFIRPLRPLLKLIPGVSEFAFDLYFSRFIKYPALAKRKTRNSNLIHVLDHSYAHLLYWLNTPFKVVTCHDLHPLFFEKNPNILKMFNYSLKGLLKADLILSDSRANRKDLIEMLGISEEKIKVVPLAVDLGKFSRVDDPREFERLRHTYNIPDGKILLHVGNSLPYKNLETAIKALGKIAKLRSEKVNFLKIGCFTLEQKILAKELGVDERLVEVSDVSDGDLAGIYSLADLLVQPSLKEGFGFPVLEAMAVGLPVLVSRGTSLTEITGKVGFTVDGFDVDEVTQKIYEALFNYNFLIHPTRENLRKQAEKFTWKRTAEETLSAYEELFSGKV